MLMLQAHNIPARRRKHIIIEITYRLHLYLTVYVACRCFVILVFYSELFIMCVVYDNTCVDNIIFMLTLYLFDI